MKIITYEDTMNKNKIVDSAYKICNIANFPVNYQDVYDHLFGESVSNLKLLLDNDNNLSGFGVFENYDIEYKTDIIKMLYISGMVINPKYQGRNLSQQIIKDEYNNSQYDFISLRTQNIAMAKSLLNMFPDNLFNMPGDMNMVALEHLRQITPFENLNDKGFVENCYYSQLYDNLNKIKEAFGVELGKTDALGVVIEPSKNKQKKLSIFK